jgi:hypothetical protein
MTASSAAVTRPHLNCKIYCLLHGLYRGQSRRQRIRSAPSPGSQLEEAEEIGKRIRFCMNLDARNKLYKILLNYKLFLSLLRTSKIV